jgi:hypothetical protein
MVPKGVIGTATAYRITCDEVTEGRPLWGARHRQWALANSCPLEGAASGKIGGVKAIPRSHDPQRGCVSHVAAQRVDRFVATDVDYLHSYLHSDAPWATADVMKADRRLRPENSPGSGPRRAGA